METKRITTPLTLKAGDEGSVQAVFSTFNVVDSDGDIVEPTAFTEGQEVPMVWSHDWANPIGKGSVKVDPDRAIFDGQFFMDTNDGAEAFRKVKAMGKLQEWSWGFRITESDFGDHEGQQVRFIKGAELFEVSPVLVGANRETHTLAIKNAKFCITCGQALKDSQTDNATGLTESSEWQTEATAQISEELERLLADVT